ncbi:MAG: Periplasmic pH-dependent serine endoprotease DegQ [Anaerolineae bacterium]|nr:Periplasmic pH-dependent serine endoprotease DegQ [Anaerolineae bacterium]
MVKNFINPKDMKMKKQIGITLALLLLAGLTACNSIIAPASAVLANQPQAAPTTLAKNETLAAIEGTLEDVYSQVNPSVVSIQVTQKSQMPALPQLPGFFFGPLGQNPQDQQPRYQYGAGSGFVWDTAGHIITNNHVVDGADKITVRLADDTMVPATVVGTDPDSDLAVLKVDLPASQLQPVSMGDSTQLKIGQLAVAIGNPFGLENTMTVGFISALGRILPVNNNDNGAIPSLGASYTIPDIIQTDAPINPGNSGGVLVNDQGQVVGVTAAIESPVRASAGIGFAIPAAIVNKVVPALIKDGHFDHSWLGVSGVSLYPELADSMKLKSDQHGALVVEVVPGGPADTAGLHGSDRQVEIDGIQARTGGDVITAIDGKPVKTFDDLVTYLAQATTVNQKVSLTVLRQGKEETISVTLAARPKTETPTMPTQPALSNGPHLGIEGVTLTPAIATAMGLKSDQQGVLVERIQTGSAADEAKLNGSFKSAAIDGQMLPVGGDVITKVDGQAVTSVAELQSIISQAKAGQKLTLTVLRDGKSVEVPVTLTDTSGGASQ